MTYPPTPGPDGSYQPPPDPPVQAYQPPPPADAYQYGYGTPPAPGYGAPATTGYDYGYPGSPYSYPPSPYTPMQPTDGMAIASLVCSCVSVLGLCLWGIGGLLGAVGAILGHVARRRIRTSGAGGSGLALAGIIVGWIMTAISLVGIALIVALIVADSSTSY